MSHSPRRRTVLPDIVVGRVRLLPSGFARGAFQCVKGGARWGHFRGAHLSLNVRTPFPFCPIDPHRRTKQRRALDSSGPFLRNTLLPRGKGSSERLLAAGPLRRENGPLPPSTPQCLGLRTTLPAQAASALPGAEGEATAGRRFHPVDGYPAMLA
jgi:hypothetical protein